MVSFSILHSCIFSEYKIDNWANAVVVVSNSLFVKLLHEMHHDCTKLYWWMDKGGVFAVNCVYVTFIEAAKILT